MEIDLRRQTLSIAIREQHDVGDARRQAMQIGKDVGFDETMHGRIGIVATELAGNLVKHAGGGALLLRLLDGGGETGIELMSLDDGPGMDAQRCMEDGYSTAGSPGTGLGAIKRLAAAFDVYSVRGKGSVVMAQLWPRDAPLSAYDIGAVCVPVAGERLCGDAWATRPMDDGLDIVVSDGLGHGPVAAEASRLALDTFGRKADLGPGAMLETMHAAMRSTRGAAVLAMRLDAAHNSLTCAGIGNICGSILDFPKSKGIVSMNGIVGHQVHKVKEFSYDCGGADVLVLHSDGLATHWKLDDFPGLAMRSASIIAGMMFKTFRRGKDDATVLVVRRR